MLKRWRRRRLNGLFFIVLLSLNNNNDGTFPDLCLRDLSNHFQTCCTLSLHVSIFTFLYICWSWLICQLPRLGLSLCYVSACGSFRRGTEELEIIVQCPLQPWRHVTEDDSNCIVISVGLQQDIFKQCPIQNSKDKTANNWNMKIQTVELSVCGCFSTAV